MQKNKIKYQNSKLIYKNNKIIDFYSIYKFTSCTLWNDTNDWVYINLFRKLRLKNNTIKIFRRKYDL